jgi:hypothetical protein
MSQMLATMGTLEQSRFQAFKRSCFAADAVQAWIAACLNDRYNRVRRSGSTSSHAEPHAKLADLVAVGQAAEIGLVVATAAKVYAQRLIADAIAFQRAQQRHQSNRHAASPDPATSITTGNNSSSSSHQKTSGWPSCLAIWTALQARRRRGVDPGFFMHPANDQLQWSAKVTTLHHYDLRRHAALAAEEEFDKQRNEARDSETEESSQATQAIASADGDDMDVDLSNT